jgi:hypothetical protein
MVVKTLNEDSLGRITFDEKKSMLKLEWLEASKDMIGPHFQGFLYILAGYAVQLKSKKILVDSRKFLFHPSQELVGLWRTCNISPLYNDAGVKKFAFLFPAGYQTPTTNIQTMPYEHFPTGFFTSENELMNWLFD